MLQSHDQTADHVLRSTSAGAVAEVVLSLLVSNFVFELSDKPIAWNISGIRFPTVGVDGTKPELPLTVSLYRGSL